VKGSAMKWGKSGRTVKGGEMKWTSCQNWYAIPVE